MRVLVVLVMLVLGGVASAHQDKYPMTSADYEKRAEQRLSRYRQRIEEHMTAQKLDEPTRQKVRTRVTALETKLRALVKQLAEDGTITLDEANQVKELGKRERDAIYRDFKLAPDKKPAKPSKSSSVRRSEVTSS